MLRKNQTKTRGSALIELAVSLPALLIMLCGALDFARVFFAGIVVESCARAAVQYGSYSLTKTSAVGGMNSAGQAEATSQGLTGVVVNSRAYCACPNGNETGCGTSCGSDTPEGYVEAVATYNFRPMLAFPGVPASIPLRAVVRFRAQ